jgi:hypothetical protein
MADRIEERIIGYDAREFWLKLDSWSEQDRNRYLYKLDIVKPLSVDAIIWPSVFSAERGQKPPDHVGFQGFWADFDRLRSAVTEYHDKEPSRDYRMIAAALMLDQETSKHPIPWDERIPRPKPDRRGPDWVFLGYDVADQFTLSGLMDCGFLPQVDDVPALRRRWGPLLNKFHLFDSYAAAADFRRFSDERMKDDHAPFFVFGLWLVK